MNKAHWILAGALALACGCSDDDAGADVDAGPAGAGPDAATIAAPRVEDYIRADRFDRLVIEVDSVPGHEPRASVRASLETTLASFLDKPAGVQIVLDAALTSRGTDHAWTEAELFALADETFDDDHGATTVAMHVLFVDGHYAGDDGPRKVLGLAWRNTHMALFAQTIEDTCSSAIGPVLQEQLCATAEEAIWLHEIGHTLGLVNNGLPMVADHRDPDHGGHDESRDCVMYFAYDGSAGVDDLAALIGTGDAVPEFDDACLADIAAVRTR